MMSQLNHSLQTYYKLPFCFSALQPNIQEQTGGVRRKKMPSPWQQLVNDKQAGTIACGWRGVDMVTVVKKGGEHIMR